MAQVTNLMSASAATAGAGERLPAHVETLSAALGVSFHDSWYEIVDGSHFWMTWRWRALARLTRTAGGPDLPSPLRGIDVGGGHGVLRDQMEAHTAWTVDLADVNPAALALSRPGRGRTLLYDVLEERADLLGRYDVATLFDVIEHLDDPVPLLRSTLRHLRPGGWLLINVPALQTLYSTYDLVIGHYRRYNARSLASQVEATGVPFAGSAIRYWGGSMLPLLALRRLIMGRKPPEKGTDIATLVATGVSPPSPLADAALSALMRAETALPFTPPLGTSVMAAYRLAADGARP
jgi:SAM-dependent methyltransferase